MITQYEVNKHMTMNGNCISSYYTLQLGENLYYGGHNIDGIELVHIEDLAARFLLKEFAVHQIEQIKRFYDKEGKIKRLYNIEGKIKRF